MCVRSWMEPNPGDTFRMHIRGGGVYCLVKGLGVEEGIGLNIVLPKSKVSSLFYPNFLHIREEFAVKNRNIIARNLLRRGFFGCSRSRGFFEYLFGLEI